MNQTGSRSITPHQVVVAVAVAVVVAVAAAVVVAVLKLLAVVVVVVAALHGVLLHIHHKLFVGLLNSENNSISSTYVW